MKKIQVLLKSDRYFIEDQYTFMIISRSFLLRMRNVAGKSCRENKNINFMFSNFFSENRAVF
jgi:hypothetical protein